MSKATLFMAFLVFSFAAIATPAEERAVTVPAINTLDIEVLRASELYGRSSEYRVDGYVGMAGSLRVRITNDGQNVFESYCCTAEPEGTSVVWRYLQSGEWITKSALKPTDFSVQLSNITAAAKDSHERPEIGWRHECQECPDGAWTEYVRVQQMDDYIGANARFVRNPRLVYLDAVKERTLIGWMYGGIKSQAEDVLARNQGSSASLDLFEVWLDPTPPGSGYWLSTAGAPLIAEP